MGCGASTSQVPGAVVNNYHTVSLRPKQSAAKVDEFEEIGKGIIPESDPNLPTFASGAPTFRGDEVIPCFDNGLLYRIVKDDIWAFYNDSRLYEMHVQFIFGKFSQLCALGTTQMTEDAETGEFVTEAVVYPGETVMYVKGSVAGHKSKIRALPLSEEFLMSKKQFYYAQIEPQLNKVNKIGESSNSEEEILTKCIKSKTLFVDINFPPTQKSISCDSDLPTKTVPWARPDMYLPSHLAPLVRVFRNKINPMVIDQGGLGDSWVMCAIATMAESPEMIRNAFRHPTDPTTTAKERAVGAHRVTINKNGWWRSVIVDNCLPVIGERPKYSKSINDPCEMWVSLFEKAYAKLHGSYSCIISGDPLHAIQDMMGYPTTRYDESFANAVEKGNMEFFERLERYSRLGFPIILSTPSRDARRPSTSAQYPASSADDIDKFYRDAGLLMGYAYTVRRVRNFQSDKIAIMEIRNPWLRGVEWKGEWGPSDKKWKEYSQIARECGHHGQEEGTFWISWKDVKKYFNGCGVVFAHPSSNDYRIRGTFKKNIPSVCVQFTVKKKVNVALMLSQEDRRGSSNAKTDYPAIILCLSSGKGSLETMQVEQNTNLDVDHPTSQFTFMQSREVGMLCVLTPENSPYLLIPRIMSENTTDIPYVIGLLTPEELGNTEVKVEFCALPDDSTAFANATIFSGKTKPVTTEFQFRRAKSGFPIETTAKEVIATGPSKDSKT